MSLSIDENPFWQFALIIPFTQVERGIMVILSIVGFLLARGDPISFIGRLKSNGRPAIFKKIQGLMEKMLVKKKEPAAV